MHEGQSLLLQVRSIGSKDKVHLFTNNIILTGKFINLLPYGDEIILSRRTRKNLDTNQQDKIMDALSESEVGLIARHNLIPENLEIAQAELQSLNQQWKEIELNAKELSEEGLVFQNTYFDQNFVCDYSDKNTDQIIFSDHDRFEKVKSCTGLSFVVSTFSGVNTPFALENKCTLPAQSPKANKFLSEQTERARMV